MSSDNSPAVQRSGFRIRLNLEAVYYSEQFYLFVDVAVIRAISDLERKIKDIFSIADDISLMCNGCNLFPRENVTVLRDEDLVIVFRQQNNNQLTHNGGNDTCNGLVQPNLNGAVSQNANMPFNLPMAHTPFRMPFNGYAPVSTTVQQQPQQVQEPQQPPQEPQPPQGPHQPQGPQQPQEPQQPQSLNYMALAGPPPRYANGFNEYCNRVRADAIRVIGLDQCGGGGGGIPFVHTYRARPPAVINPVLPSGGGGAAINYNYGTLVRAQPNNSAATSISVNIGSNRPVTIINNTRYVSTTTARGSVPCASVATSTMPRNIGYAQNLSVRSLNHGGTIVNVRNVVPYYFYYNGNGTTAGVPPSAVGAGGAGGAIDYSVTRGYWPPMNNNATVCFTSAANVVTISAIATVAPVVSSVTAGMMSFNGSSILNGNGNAAINVPGIDTNSAVNVQTAYSDMNSSSSMATIEHAAGAGHACTLAGQSTGGNPIFNGAIDGTYSNVNNQDVVATVVDGNAQPNTSYIIADNSGDSASTSNTVATYNSRATTDTTDEISMSRCSEYSVSKEEADNRANEISALQENIHSNITRMTSTYETGETSADDSNMDIVDADEHGYEGCNEFVFCDRPSERRKRKYESENDDDEERQEAEEQYTAATDNGGDQSAIDVTSAGYVQHDGGNYNLLSTLATGTNELDNEQVAVNLSSAVDGKKKRKRRRHHKKRNNNRNHSENNFSAPSVLVPSFSSEYSSDRKHIRFTDDFDNSDSSAGGDINAAEETDDRADQSDVTVAIDDREDGLHDQINEPIIVKAADGASYVATMDKKRRYTGNVESDATDDATVMDEEIPYTGNDESVSYDAKINKRGGGGGRRSYTGNDESTQQGAKMDKEGSYVGNSEKVSKMDKEGSYKRKFESTPKMNNRCERDETPKKEIRSADKGRLSTTTTKPDVSFEKSLQYLMSLKDFPVLPQYNLIYDNSKQKSTEKLPGNDQTISSTFDADDSSLDKDGADDSARDLEKFKQSVAASVPIKPCVNYQLKSVDKTSRTSLTTVGTVIKIYEGDRLKMSVDVNNKEACSQFPACGSPKVGDVITFYILKLNDHCTPVCSEIICGKIVDVAEDLKVTLEILVGKAEFKKINTTHVLLETCYGTGEEATDDDFANVKRNWPELVTPKLIASLSE